MFGTGSVGITANTGIDPNAPGGASNGLSVDSVSGDAVLGQDVGALGDPAQLLNNRDVPLFGYLLTLLQSLTGANATEILLLKASWNTAGIANAFRIDITDAAPSLGAKFARFVYNGADVFLFGVTGTMDIKDLVASGDNFYIRQNSVLTGALDATGEGIVNVRGEYRPSSGVAGFTPMVDIKPRIRPSGGTGDLVMLRFIPNINATGGTYVLRGVLYDPIETLLTGIRQIAYENVAGDNVFNSTSGSTMIGISVNAANARLLIAAGTTARAPLQLTSGPLRTTPIPGSIEFLADALYFTITTGAARLQLTTQSGSIPVNAVAVGDATGSLVGSTALTYNGNQLNVQGASSVGAQVLIYDTDATVTFLIFNDGGNGVVSFSNDVGSAYTFDGNVLVAGAVYCRFPVFSDGSGGMLTSAESRVLLYNIGSIVKTLPATPSLGTSFTFYIDDAAGLTVQSSGTQTIRWGTSVTVAGGSISSIVVGSCITLVYIGNDKWVAMSLIGTWL
jgi:hypothetical protein